jgi:hypothetical protein
LFVCLVNITFPFALVIHSKNGEYLFMVNTKSNKTTKDIGEHMKKLLISGLVLASATMSSLTYAPKVEAATAANWVECANEGSTCYLPSLRPTVVRYGAYNPIIGKYTYITAIVSNDELLCDNSVFANDPVQVNKTCEYMPIEYKTNSTNRAWGQWAAIVDNESSDSQTITYAVHTGVTQTDTDSTSQEWAASITTGIETGGLKLGVAEVTVSTSLTSAYATSTTLSTALSLSKKEIVEVSCHSLNGGFTKMWQSQTEIGFNNCLSDGVCTFNVLPMSTLCTTADVIPQCMPG